MAHIGTGGGGQAMDDRWEEAARRLAAEELLTTAEAAALVPAARGGRCSAGTVACWITRGKDGVYLDGLRATGRGWRTSRAALVRFWAAVARREAGDREARREAAAKAAPSAAESRREASRAEVLRLLAKKGKS